MRLLIALLLLTAFSASAQQKFYFVAFKDKPHYKEQMYKLQDYLSIKAIERRTRNRVPLNMNDVPPEKEYLDKLADLPLMMYGNSRWFNGTVVLSDVKSISDSIKALPFVASVTYLGPAYFYEEEDNAKENSLENQLNILEQAFENKKGIKDSVWAGRSYKQINQLNDLTILQNGVGGKGVLIAVLDAGFQNLDQLPPFQHLLREKRIVAAYDFVEKEEEVFEDDDHGLSVMSCLAANQPGLIMGTAPQANYLLLRTENAATEYLVEEYFWALAAEFADSAGADIINSSLGYSKHDEKSMGHKYSELDGKTTLVTRAAEIAASKGILVLVSAGNEGDDPWRQLCAPADGPHVLTVGAIDRFGSYAGFSSVGPTADRRLKPDLVAMGKGATLISGDGKIFEGNGTSYSCPLISGAAAQMLQLAPQTSAEKIKEALTLSANQYYKADKYIGAGLPDVALAIAMVTAKLDTLIDIRELPDMNWHLTFYVRTNQKVNIIIKEPITGEIERQSLTLKKGLNRIAIKGHKKRPAGLYQLSVDFQNRTVVRDFMKP
jgi:hypothetical protein